MTTKEVFIEHFWSSQFKRNNVTHIYEYILWNTLLFTQKKTVSTWMKLTQICDNNNGKSVISYKIIKAGEASFTNLVNKC
jgi:hypothetical protein